MKKLYTLVLIVFALTFSACSSDDNEGCEYIYTGSTYKDGDKYFVYYYSTNGGGEESVRVPEEIYSWIIRGHLNSGDCFDVNKYRFIE